MRWETKNWCDSLDCDICHIVVVWNQTRSIPEVCLYIQILGLTLTRVVVWDRLLYFSGSLFPLLGKGDNKIPLDRVVETITLNEIKIDFCPNLFNP